MRNHTTSASALLVVSLSCIASGSGAAVAVATEGALPPAFVERLESGKADLVELRHDIHRHPETSGREERTAGLVAERLRGLGLEVSTGVGGHGVIALLRGGEPGGVVAFRADMDAIASDAPDPVDYRSLTPGVRHICGHDVHTTIGVALAEGLAAIRAQIPGTVKLIFQPAEENASGAKAMLAAGALENPRPDAIFAFHTAPMNVGQLVTTPEGLMAGRDRVLVRIESSPDPEAMATTVRDRIQALSTISPQQSLGPAPPDFVFVQVAVRPPGAGGSWSVQGAITTASRAARAGAHVAVEALVKELGRDDNVLGLEYEERYIAGVTNDPALTARATSAVDGVLGAGAVATLPAVVPAFSEDFGSFQEQVPGTMFFLGVSNPEKGIVGMPHSPGYAADDEAIMVGARAMAAVLLDFLESERPK